MVFYSGARVVIEGPTELQLISPMEAVCPAGRLLAEVPQPARGFRLKTAQLNVVDLGTVFGIDATVAKLKFTSSKGQWSFLPEKRRRQSWSEGRAAVVRGSDTASPHGGERGGLHFAVRTAKTVSAAEAIRYDQWRVASARLNQDPSLVVHLDLENLGDSDWTLRNAAEKNKSVPEATMVGCQRAEGRWPEKQALEFQSVNDRVRLAVPGELRFLDPLGLGAHQGTGPAVQLAFHVRWLRARNDSLAHPQRWRFEPDVKGAGQRDFQIMASPPVLTLDKFGMWTHLAVVLDGRARQSGPLRQRSPVSRHALKLGPPYRIGSAELGNWNARAARTRLLPSSEI